VCQPFHLLVLGLVDLGHDRRWQPLENGSDPLDGNRTDLLSVSLGIDPKAGLALRYENLQRGHGKVRGLPIIAVAGRSRGRSMLASYGIERCKRCRPDGACRLETVPARWWPTRANRRVQLTGPGGDRKVTPRLFPGRPAREVRGHR
jgi:hypothetical protein